MAFPSLKAGAPRPLASRSLRGRDERGDDVLDELLTEREAFPSGGGIKLNLGCGTDYKPGWVNVDNNSDRNITQLDLNWDLANPLPYGAGTVDFIFNEHLIEHLSVEQARATIADCLRVLRPGGVLRIAMPDLAMAVEKYLHLPIDQDESLRTFGLQFVTTRAERMNMAFRWWGHQWLYDWEELVRRLHEVGCSDQMIRRCRLHESSHPELCGLETRAESVLIAEVVR
jgi:predicted SAM-dependent methyltransferase